MKFNGTIFSKPQQDQLKENIGNELEKVSANAMKYRGTWTLNMQCYANDVVTFGSELFVALKDNNGKKYPPQDATNWKKIGVTQQKSLQRGSADIALTDVGNYEPSQIPEAVFEAMLDGRHLMFRITEKTNIGEEIKYTLSSPVITGEQTANIYIITVKAKAGVINAYKFSLTSSGITINTISSIPSTIKVYFDFT